MNVEQIIQSTDPSLGPVSLHPSCYVFPVARSQNLIPSHRARSCEPSQSILVLQCVGETENVSLRLHQDDDFLPADPTAFFP